MIFPVKKKKFHTNILRMVDFGEGTGGKGYLIKGCDIFVVRNHLW
jgi:hypothetical protein